MKNFYMIPLVENDVYIENNYSLAEYLKENYFSLYQAECERINILYSVSPFDEMPEHLQKKYNNHKKETRKTYDKMGIPYYLIAYGNDKKAKEISTKTTITSKYQAVLGVRKVSYEKVKDYLFKSNYEKKVYNLLGINKYNNKNIKKITKSYKINGHINGKLDGQDICGEFKGKVKVLK